MVTYTCPKCLKEFKQKGHFIDHTEKKKKPCQQNLQKFAQICTNLQEFAENENSVIIGSNVGVGEGIHNCQHCNKEFSSIYTLNRHLSSYCKIKKQKDEETNKQNDLLMIQMMELKKILEIQNKEIQELKNKKPVSKLVINNHNNNTTTTNTLNAGSINTGNTNNINLMPHGKEDFSKIELKSILECLCNENFQEIVPSMVKHIYIDKNYPEFHNFKVLDLARNKSEYYDGKDWVVGKADDGLIKIFENVNTALVEPFDKDNIDKTIKFIRNNEELKKKYQWINWSKNYCVNLFKDTEKEYIEDRNKILNELKLIFYNYKDQILAS